MGLDVIRYLEERVKVIVAHPGLFIVAVILGAFGGLAWRGQEVANHASRVEVVERENESLKAENERLKGLTETPANPAPPASPDSQQSQQLTPEEIDRIRAILAGQPSFIEIMGLPNSQWSRAVTATFVASGWKVDEVVPTFASNRDIVTLTWNDAAATQTIRRAFDSIGAKYQLTVTGDAYVMTLPSAAREE